MLEIHFNEDNYCHYTIAIANSDSLTIDILFYVKNLILYNVIPPIVSYTRIVSFSETSSVDVILSPVSVVNTSTLFREI